MPSPKRQYQTSRYPTRVIDWTGDWQRAPYYEVLDEILYRMRAYAKDLAPREILASFLGVTPSTIWCWVTREKRPIRQHWEWLCEAFPSLMTCEEPIFPHHEEKPGPATDITSRYFERKRLPATFLAARKWYRV